MKKPFKKTLQGVFGTVRALRPVAAVLGPKYKRAKDWIEIDITYACNLSCFNCNRSVRQAPGGDRVTVEQIEKFLKESVDKGVMWRRVRLLGGEPTVHPQFFEIVALLTDYRRRHSPKMLLAVHTNGYGDKVGAVLDRLPPDIKVVSTAKTGVRNLFYPFNLAPRDSGLHRWVDYSMGCRVPQHCGTGLNAYGYYPCAVAAGIDRVIGLDIGRKELPDRDDLMAEELRQLCQWCGNFRLGGYNKWEGLVDFEVMSSSWKDAYERYRTNRPKLTHY